MDYLPVFAVSTAVKQRDIGLMETNMITIPNTPMIGGKRRGIWTPGAVTIGRVKAGSQNVVIDLTTTQLDSRLTYTGPAHSYLGSDEKLSTSAENEWPIEYVNGVAVGRHEPEPAATNLFGSIMLENMTSLPGSDGLQNIVSLGPDLYFTGLNFGRQALCQGILLTL